MTTLARSTANRAVHLRISPRPSSISESREILRLVSQFGEVEYYKNLKYDTLSHPSTSLVIFREEKAAEACLKRSPIRFRLGPVEADFREQVQVHNTYSAPAPAAAAAAMPTSTPKPQPTNIPASKKGPLSAPFGMAQSQNQTRTLSTHTLPSPPRPTPTLPFLPPDQPSHTQQQSQFSQRIFQLQTNPARISFRDAIDRSEYHGRYTIDSKSAIQQDLAKRVPLKGMSCWDWRKGEKPERIVRGLRKGEVMKGLAEVWEEGRKNGEVKEG